ncbi:putative membrane protein [Goodfellowiella coeruleoviolacea]|uniref:Membrane protein n=2 Tax=Goodfellowiella coeruleoviolacea TaxID=334858 RepID=A0AAE3GLC5_9PSEU|nr:putative membrane protein [Goodfellowiella coeruleoviolacea]
MNRRSGVIGAAAGYQPGMAATANPTAATRRREPAALLVLVLLAVAVSAIRPHDYATWVLEVAPILVAIPLLVVTFARHRLTPIAYRVMAGAALLMSVGAHYTYAEVPFGDWMRDWFGFARNHYDRIGHVAQGLVAAVITRELLVRRTPLRPGGWLAVVVTAMCLGISATFELVEVVAGLIGGGVGDAYLGTQGDPVDAQWDMAMALLGALLAQLLLGRAHNRQLGWTGAAAPAHPAPATPAPPPLSRARRPAA